MDLGKAKIAGWLVQLVERFVYTETVNGSSPLSPKKINMFSILNFWTIFLFTTVLISIYIFVYINVFGGFAEIKWKLFYFFFSWFITLIYLFFEIDVILQQFSSQLGDLLIIKDLQDLINLSLDISIWLSFWFVFPILIFYFWTFFLHGWNRQEYQSWGLYFSLLLYFFFLFKIFLDNDLFLTSWDFFKKTPHIFYDFQPDFFYIIMSYLGDFMDLINFFILLLCGFLLLFLFQGALQNFNFLFSSVFFRGIFGLIFSGILFYFLGGESFLRDSFLFLITIFCFEIYYFLFIFFLILKQKKIY